MDLGGGIRQQSRRPVFVGEAEPGVGHVPAFALLVLDLLVGLFLQAIVAHHADQALVQDVVAEHFGVRSARRETT